jgi:hypothetical protein
MNVRRPKSIGNCHSSELEKINCNGFSPTRRRVGEPADQQRCLFAISEECQDRKPIDRHSRPVDLMAYGAVCPATVYCVVLESACRRAFQVELPFYTLIFKLWSGRRMHVARIYRLLEKWVSKDSNATSTVARFFDLHLRPDRYNSSIPSNGAA